MNPLPPFPTTPKLLFRVRLKDRHETREVIVSARDLPTATEVGNAYCLREKYKFIRAEPMVVADENILR